MSIPTVVTKAGLQPQTPSALLAQLLALVASTTPGYTAQLPGSLIEDISSTDVGAVSIIDAARVELVNSLTPYGANEFLLNQLGQIYGVQADVVTNTSVNVIFTGSVGFIVPAGFVVSDGTYQYVVQSGGVIGSGGVTVELYCLATIAGSWAVPINTVNQLITSVPTYITLSVNNLIAGTPSSGEQTTDDYRAQVINAGLVAAQGMPTYVKTLLNNVAGVQSRLISIQQQTIANGGGWKILVGGGDLYAQAYAIYQGLFDVSLLVGSVLNVTAITKATAGVVTTDLNHGYTSGQVVYINGILGMTALNGIPLTITVISLKTFSIGVNTTSYPTYISGGICTPNLRNNAISIIDSPDTYTVTYVTPPQQIVTVGFVWNSVATNAVTNNAVSQLAAPALVTYINSITVGQPVNIFTMQSVFTASIATLIPANLITRMVINVFINGILTAPDAGTGAISGDIEGYFYAASNAITIQQG